MPNFDASAFAKSALAEFITATKPILKDTSTDLSAFKEAARSLEASIEATLGAIAVSTDALETSELKRDLEIFLPARKAAIESILASSLSGDGQVVFETAWRIISKAAIITASAFVSTL